ncbi:MAG: AAA family ATPase [Candidatus Paceibacterota bacterium]|jgi:MoxR-like ATPase
MKENFEPVEEQPVENKPEKRSRDDLIIEENEIANRLEKERGIFYCEKDDEKSGEKKGFVNILGVELETSATKEELENIKNELIFSNTDQKIIKMIATCYKLHQPLMLEGAPGLGKTFLVEKFSQMIHGEKGSIVNINGTPKTSELEILGHWAPKGLKEEENQRYNEEFNSVMNKKENLDLQKSFNQELGKLNSELSQEIINEDEYKEKFGELSTRYIEETKRFLQSTQLNNFIKPGSDWEFQRGALMESYVGNNGRGKILFVDEFNIIPSNYQQIFLQISGKRGGLSDSINFWGNGNQTKYERGEDTFIVFASNYPETTEGRNVVSDPMTDRLVWYSIPGEDAKEKRRIAILSDGGNLKSVLSEEIKVDKEKNKPVALEQILWKKELAESLGRQITSIGLFLDENFEKQYQQVGDSIDINGSKRRRTQKLELSPRNFYRFSDYISDFQTRNNETGFVDFTETLQNAFEMYYVNRLASPELRENMKKLFNEIMAGSTGKVNFEEKVMTRKEVLDILTERASLTEEERKKIKIEEEERIRKAAELAKNNAMDKEEALRKRNLLQKTTKKIND